MNRQTFFCFATLTLTLCVYSCKKDKKDTTVIPPATVYPDYTVLKAGNYWVYQDYKLDSVNGAAHALGTYDSLFIDKDTVINGNTYHKYWDASGLGGSANPAYNIYYLRDSLNYTVTNTGAIKFSSDDFSRIFSTSYLYEPTAGISDTITINTEMGFKDSSMTVDAGTFVTSSLRQIYFMPAPAYQYGPTREYDHSYAKGIGLIKETTGFYTNLPEIHERRLVRYHVQ